MAAAKLASVIITNYNYGRFLRESIESAINQTYANVEVIVVDDGSTDDSREVMASYGDRITPVLKANGGMGSAFNAGFAVSRGEVVCFLDADDTLLPRAMEMATGLFHDPTVAKAHWPLRTVEESGRMSGDVHPSEPLSEGDFRQQVIRRGGWGYRWPMTSGNAWSRPFLERVLPMPEEEYRTDAEGYLATLAPAFGLVKRIAEPMATYRMHRDSMSNTYPILERKRLAERRHAAVRRGFRKLGVDVDTELWKPPSGGAEQVISACEELAALIPLGSSFIFVEWEQWGPGQVIAGCCQIPFLERDGQYWGCPPDDATAIVELERLRRSGASFIVFASPALWWLEYYSGLHHHLRSGFRCILENERLVVFDLRSEV